MKTKVALPLLVGLYVFTFTSCENDGVKEPKKSEKDLNKKENTSARFAAPEDIVGVDYSKQDGKMYYWISQGRANGGTYLDTDPFGSASYKFTAATGKQPNQIAEIAIYAELGVNRCYAYYLDGTMSIGYSNDLDAVSLGTSAYVCAPGKTPANIVGLAINSLGNAYTWYDDGTVSVGSTTNLGSVNPSYGYTTPPGKTYSDIVSVAIDRTNSDKVYTWYSDGTVSIGISNDLDYYNAPVPFD